MAKGHSKKRNSALLYNFLVRKISTALVEGNERLANRALKIMKSAFRPGTELHRELRLMNALVRSTVSAPSTASSIINEAKLAVRSHDSGALDREKSLLIRNINHRLNDDLFYEQHVPDYRILATVQTLINEWRRPTGDLEKVAQYEDVLTNHLLSEKAPEPDGGFVESSSIDSRLLVKAMTKRLNERYSTALTPFQKEVLRMYALSSGNSTTLKQRLEEIRANVLDELDAYIVEGNQHEVQALTEARAKISSEDVSSLDDDLIARFMMYSNLLDELRNKEGL